ncbi:hypothetical protein ABW19_dt0205870 [Dactylella cylindrospora]|nr:hypothetical protein ABW19_dt0205870 [Dactylella cylindrospora]
MQRRNRNRYADDLESRTPLIDAICKVTGTAGLSCGVLYDGEEVFKHHYGFRDVGEQIRCNDDTIYAVGSLTKAFTACGCAIAVEEEKLSWDNRIEQRLPGFKFSDDYISKNLTLEDILCQRSGLANPASLWLGKNNEILLPNNQLIRTCNNLPTMDDFRTGFRYNNFLYSLAGQILGHAYGDDTPQGYMHFVKDRIFEPLKLTRTSFDINPSEKNVAKGYVTLDNGELHELPYPGLNSKDGGVLAPCGGVRSSLNDMLDWTNALMKSALDGGPLISHGKTAKKTPNAHGQFRGSSIYTKLRSCVFFCLGDGPSEDVIQLNDSRILVCEKSLDYDTTVLEKSYLLLAPHNAGLASLALDPPSLLETSYALGWCRQSTPAKFSLFSKNRELVPDEIPLIAAGKSSTLTISHVGNLPGFASIIIMIPELRCAIVVLTNTDTLGDVADWISQVLLEALLDPDSLTDFEDLARKAATKDKEFFKEQIEAPYCEARKIGAPSTSPEDFVGTYYGLGGSFKLVVQLKPSSQLEPDSDSQLVLKVAGKDSQSYDLSYYDLDSWGFLPTGMYLKTHAVPYQYWESFILRFRRRDSDGTVCGVSWILEEGMESTFFERDGT